MDSSADSEWVQPEHGHMAQNPSKIPLPFLGTDPVEQYPLPSGQELPDWTELES